jgi:hypothetical protein
MYSIAHNIFKLWMHSKKPLSIRIGSINLKKYNMFFTLFNEELNSEYILLSEYNYCPEGHGAILFIDFFCRGASCVYFKSL